jgi:hypothetical protein
MTAEIGVPVGRKRRPHRNSRNGCLTCKTARKKASPSVQPLGISIDQCSAMKFGRSVRDVSGYA